MGIRVLLWGCNDMSVLHHWSRAFFPGLRSDGQVLCMDACAHPSAVRHAVTCQGSRSVFTLHPFSSSPLAFSSRETFCPIKQVSPNDTNTHTHTHWNHEVALSREASSWTRKCPSSISCVTCRPSWACYIERAETRYANCELGTRSHSRSVYRTS